MGGSGPEKCDARAAVVFLIGLGAGTGCTICSKALFEMRAVGLSGALACCKQNVQMQRLSQMEEHCR